MSQRAFQAFYAVESTAPAFIAGASNVFTSTASVLESSAVNRIWKGPGGRAVRLVSAEAANGVTGGFYYALGSSLIVANSTDGIFVPAGVVSIVQPQPSDTYIAVLSVSTSTGAKVNVTLGYGR